MNRARAAILAAFAAVLSVVGITPAFAGSTVGFNDSISLYITVVEDGRYYGLAPGRTSRGQWGLADIDTVVLASNQCGQIQVDYGPWRVITSNATGISSSAGVVHVKTYPC